jgi:hypothetical protein
MTDAVSSLIVLAVVGYLIFHFARKRRLGSSSLQGRGS